MAWSCQDGRQPGWLAQSVQGCIHSALDKTISTFTTLEPGDIIATGTPGGVGYKREPQLFMFPGDKVEVEVEGVGLLSNEIRA